VRLPDLRQNPAIAERVLRYYERYYAPLTPHWRKLAGDVLDLERERERIARLESDLSLALEGRRVLEIGSGFGLFVAAARGARAAAFGIEPDELACETARLVLEAAGVGGGTLCRGEGENVPFADAVFDLVCSFQVLEHTREPERVLREALRVLRPGGFLYFVVPNYNSFWESHYGVLWLPRLNKRVGKLLLRLLGRSPDFLDTIRYITPRRLRAALERIEVPFEILSWGKETWRRRLVGGDVTRWGQTGPLRRAVAIASALRLTRLVAWAGERLEFFYPIILVLKRTG